MSDKTPTAVGWLVQQLSSSRYFYSIMEELESRSTIVQPNSILHQAIEMEKQQIMRAVEDGFNEGCKHPEDIKIYTASQYYTETYEQLKP